MNRTIIIFTFIVLLFTGCRQKQEKISQDNDSILDQNDTLPLSRNLVFMDFNAVSVGEGVRLRIAPDIKAEVVDKLNTGSLLKIIRKNNIKVSMGQVNECDPDGYFWYEVIASDGNRGWIYGEFIYKLIIPGRKHEMINDLTSELLKKSFNFSGKNFKMSFAEAERTMVYQGTYKVDTMCVVYQMPLFYNDQEGVVYPLQYFRNRKNRIDMDGLTTDKGYYQMLLDGRYDDFIDAFRMTDNELQLTIARDFFDDDPFRYTLIIKYESGIFTATPADPGKEFLP